MKFKWGLCGTPKFMLHALDHVSGLHGNKVTLRLNALIALRVFAKVWHHKSVCVPINNKVVVFHWKEDELVACRVCQICVSHCSQL